MVDENQQEKSIEQKLIYNNYKLVADKIRKTLLNIKNAPGISAKRWIWELIQNAKDVPNKFKKVDIKIHLKENSLIFSHNGSYFTIDNILGILQQVSSKDSKNLHDQTGKFGTGFIGTHLLSEKVKIKGIVKYRGNFRRFKIKLDRSAESSEELLKKVEKSIDEFKNNMGNDANSEYKKISDYSQKQTDFDTIFKYQLKDDNALNIAKEGLNDLIFTAPVTMATQYKRIRSITIKNDIEKCETTYSIEKPVKLEENIYQNIINIKSEKDDKKILFYSYETDTCRLLYQVEVKEGKLLAIERGEKQPVLLRDFPLIGSENFHFPFFLDGFKFNPLETRNGLYLNGNYEEAIENRNIIEKAISSSIEFTDWILQQHIDKTYLLAKTNIPESPQNYDNIFINWFLKVQKDWREKLIKKRLLKSNYTLHTLEKLKIPQFKGYFNETFFSIVKEVNNITGGIIPDKDDVKIWYNIMEKDPLIDDYKIKEKTWNFDYLLTEEQLFKKIDECESIDKLAEDLNVDTHQIIVWLKKLYSFLSENKSIDYLNRYKMIPNQKKEFKKISDIFGNREDEDKSYKNGKAIDNEINVIYKDIFNKEINDIIVYEEIDLSVFGNNLKKKNIIDILNEFSDFFKEENDPKKKDFLCNVLLSFKIYKEVNNGEYIEDDILQQMFNYKRESQPDYRDKKKKELLYSNEHNIWREVKDHWFDNHPKIIESYKNIDGLSQNLINDNPLNWLNNYINFLKINYHPLRTEKMKIFPNQNGEFKILLELFIDDSIPEIIKDIYNELKRSKENDNYDIKNKLLKKEIDCCEGHEKLTQNEIISEIEFLFDKNKNDGKKIQICEKIIINIPNNQEEKYKTINMALKELIPLYNCI